MAKYQRVVVSPLHPSPPLWTTPFLQAVSLCFGFHYCLSPSGPILSASGLHPHQLDSQYPGTNPRLLPDLHKVVLAARLSLPLLGKRPAKGLTERVSQVTRINLRVNSKPVCLSILEEGTQVYSMQEMVPPIPVPLFHLMLQASVFQSHLILRIIQGA